MTIEKLNSGSWRIKKMYKRKMYCLTVQEKPSKREAERLINKKIEDEYDNLLDEKKNMTFLKAANSYMELKKNVLSPSTIKGYKSMANQISKKLASKRIDDVTAIDIQKEINDFTQGHTPKYVSNYHGFLSAVLSTYRPNLNLKTTLPQKEKKEMHTPIDDEVTKIFKLAKGTAYEVPFVLAACGLRRSEIMAIKGSDVVGNRLIINKAKVLDENNQWCIKTTKTVESTRSVLIPDDIATKIKNQGCAFKGHPTCLIKKLHTYQEMLDIPKFRLHDLRAYYASMMHALGVPDSYIMESGGWQSDYVMKKVYRKALEDKKENMQSLGVSYLTDLMR